jgi:phospholipid/cholesterol/gamma-HCH transport system substrate-binding protein
MADRASSLRLGLFTAASLAALTGVVVLFGGSQNLFTSRNNYTVVFPEAPGLAVGTPVRKSGVRIGQVTSIDLDDNTGKVRVSIALDPKYPLRKSDDATISRGLLSGDTSLDFLPKLDVPVSTTPELYEANSEIIGIAPISARTLLKGASDVIPNAQDNIAKVVNSIQRFEQAVPKIEKAIEEIALLARSGREFVPELRQTNIKVQNLLGLAEPDDKDEPANLKAIFKQLIAVLQALQPAADEIRNLVKTNGPEIGKTIVAVRQSAEGVNDVLNPENRKAIAGTLKNVQTGTDDLVRTIRIAALFLDTAEKTVKDINARIAQAERVIDNVDKATKPFADNSAQLATGLSETLKNLNGASDQLTKALGEIRTTVNTVNRGEGTVGKAINDPTLYNNLNETTANVARLMMRLDKISRDLEVFADKIARKPETIGVGGVVRPSTGLKESPNAPLPPSPLLPIAPAQPTVPTVLPLAPGMPQSGPLMPIAPVPFGPTGTPPQTVYKPEMPKK